MLYTNIRCVRRTERTAVNRKGRTLAIVGGITAAVLLVVTVTLMTAVDSPSSVNVAATTAPAPTTTAPTSSAPTSAPAPTATTATPAEDKPGFNCSRHGKRACRPKSASPSPKLVVMPNVVGKNAAVTDDELRRLGFTRVQYRSAEPGDSVGRQLADWTITKQSMVAGSKVATDTLIVLTAVKE